MLRSHQGQDQRRKLTMLRWIPRWSGKSNDSEFLTGVFASESVWDRFEKCWREILAKYHISDFHTSEAMSLRGRFSKQNGWSKPKVYELVKDLWNVIRKHRWTEDFSLNSNLYARSCTVKMQDYYQAKSANPKLREAEAICTQFCLNTQKLFWCLIREKSFLKTLYRNWIKGRNLPTACWPKQIKGIEFGNAAKSCPMQAADLIAWTIGRHHRARLMGILKSWGRSS